jgi:hypothetical protein
MEDYRVAASGRRPADKYLNGAEAATLMGINKTVPGTDLPDVLMM